MQQLGILIGLLLLLYFIAKNNIQLIYRFFKLVFRFDSLVYVLITLLFFPGTVLHESAHLLMAIVLFLPVREVSFIPQIKDQGIKLGYVVYSKRDKVRGILVGIAPILLGIVTLGLIAYFQVWQINWVFSILFGYIVFAISSTMFSSKQDMVDFIILIPIAIIIGLLFFLFPGFIQYIVSEHGSWVKTSLKIVTNINIVLAVTLLVQLGVMVVLRVLLKILNR